MMLTDDQLTSIWQGGLLQALKDCAATAFPDGAGTARARQIESAPRGPAMSHFCRSLQSLNRLIVRGEIRPHDLAPVVSPRIDLREEISGQGQRNRLFPGGFVAGLFLRGLHDFFGTGAGISLIASSNNSRACSTCRLLKLRREARNSFTASRIANSTDMGIIDSILRRRPCRNNNQGLALRNDYSAPSSLVDRSDRGACGVWPRLRRCMRLRPHRSLVPWGVIHRGHSARSIYSFFSRVLAFLGSCHSPRPNGGEPDSSGSRCLGSVSQSS
jgi:hypothetical protein